MGAEEAVKGVSAVGNCWKVEDLMATRWPKSEAEFLDLVLIRFYATKTLGGFKFHVQRVNDGAGARRPPGVS